MKDTIREYFKTLLEEGFDIEASKDNLMEIIDEISQEIEENE